MTALIQKLYGLLLFNAPLVSFNLVTVLALLVVACRPEAVRLKMVLRVEKALNRIAIRPWLAIAFVGGVSLLLNVGISLFVLLPQPRVHDEFGNLLLADTFAHGRLTNPTHPVWQQIESLYVIYEPGYASKYPPALGIFLALGQVLTGHAVVGTWVSTALACVAVFWMLRAWVPPRWALIGGFIAVVHPKVLLWGQGFWGGQVAMLGGALLVGGFRRLLDHPQRGAALWMMLGVALLANSRPYEGFVITALVGAVLIERLLRKPTEEFRTWIAKLWMPLGAAIILLVVWTGYYNWRVTGHVLRLPQAHWAAQYETVPRFVWLNLKPEPTYRHAALREFLVGWETTDFIRQRSSVGGFLTGVLERLSILLWGPFRLWFLLIPMCFLPFAMKRDLLLRRMILIGAVFSVVLLLVFNIQSHYPAPAWGVLFVVVVLCLRYLSIWRRHVDRRGQAITRVILMLCVVSLIPSIWHIYRVNNDEHAMRRAQILKALHQSGGQHLIFVQTSPNEWVFNDADIDHSTVVWARDMGDDANQKLLRYYPKRTAWVLTTNSVTKKEDILPLTSTHP